MNANMTIGKVAKGAGVNLQTIRFYERKRLLMPEIRKDSGYRLYSNEAIKRIRFIKNAQGLGFSLKEVSGLLQLRVSQQAQCHTVKRKAENKLRDVRIKISGLRKMESVLNQLVHTCARKGKTSPCPILESLET